MELNMANGNSAFLLIIPGAVITGLGLGLIFGQPGFGLITGSGIGLLLWGLIVALVR